MKQESHISVVYPGSFDPLTLGHLDIIERASRLFDMVIVAVADPLHKKTSIPIDKRVDIIKKACSHLKNVEVEVMKGLLVDFVRKKGSKAIIRGLRAVSDFEYEFKMAWMNRRMNPDIETIFLIPSEEYAYISSSLVKEIGFLGGDISTLVPECVVEEIKEFLTKRPTPEEMDETRGMD